MPRILNVALKTAMFATGKHQQRIAKAARIAPQKLSHVIYGRRVLDHGERERLARVLASELGKSEAEITAEVFA